MDSEWFTTMDGRRFKETDPTALAFHRKARANYEATVLKPAEDERLGRVPVALQALDELGVALACHGHRWTPRERSLYERAVKTLKPKR